MTPERWPVHPAPLPREALSSWLRRIALLYGATVEDLVADLGFWPGRAADLDICPPGGFAHELSNRTGVGAHRIRRMSLSGWSPWLLDTTEPDPQMFTNYTRKFSVLLPAGRRRTREIYPWLPWCPSLPAIRACPICVATTTPPHPYQLLWLLPVTLSCPLHGCRLEAHKWPVLDFRDWQRKPPVPRPVSPILLAMDTRTWQGLATGSVDLLRLPIGAGTWFRLMRTIIDELGVTLSESGNGRSIMMKAWVEAGHPFRMGLLSWHAHEDHQPSSQILALEATATAIRLLETNTLIGRGQDAAIFRPAAPGA